MTTADKPTSPPRLRAVSTPRTAATAADMGPQRPSPLRNVNRPQAVSSVPLRMLHQEQLHRVDAAQLPRGAGVSLGHCRTDIALCFGDPDCAHHQCPGHPCNQAQQAKAKTMAELEAEAVITAFDLAGKDHSDHHGPRSMAEYHAGRALFWRCYIGLVLIALALLAKWWLTR